MDFAQKHLRQSYMDLLHESKGDLVADLESEDAILSDWYFKHKASLVESRTGLMNSDALK